MAKICKEEQGLIALGYAQAVADKTSHKPQGSGKTNPSLWSSVMWEAFEFGYYLGETGRSLTEFERGRGNTYRNADGFSYKLQYGKGKNSFGITRLT